MPIFLFCVTLTVTFYLWNHLKGSYKFVTGILSSNMRSLSPKWYPIFLRMTIYSDILHWTDVTSMFDPVTDLDRFPEFDFLRNCRKFPYDVCNGCSMHTEDAYSSGHLIMCQLGTCKCSNVDTNLSWICKCSNVETNLSWICPVSGLLEFQTSLCTTVLLVGPPSCVCYVNDMSTSIDDNSKLMYKKVLLLRCIHHFKSDIVNNMDHMCIAGN